MKISPAPNNYPSGTRPEAVGAGVQFATDPIHGMRTRDSLPALTMQNGTGTGSVAFNQCESSAENQAGPRSNTTAPNLRGSAHPSIGRHGSADLHGARATFQQVPARAGVTGAKVGAC